MNNSRPMDEHSFAVHGQLSASAVSGWFGEATLATELRRQDRQRLSCVLAQGDTHGIGSVFDVVWQMSTAAEN